MEYCLFVNQLLSQQIKKQRYIFFKALIGVFKPQHSGGKHY